MKLNSFDKAKSYTALFTETPSLVPCDKVPDGPLFGNGDIGVVAGGNTDTLTFWISKNDFWSASLSHHTEMHGGVRGLAWLKLESHLLQNACFSARQLLHTAEVEIDLTTDQLHMHVRAYAPRKQNLAIFEIKAVQGDIPLHLYFSPLADEKAEFSRRVENDLTYIYKGYVQNTAWESEAVGCMRIISGNLKDGMLHEGETLTTAISIFTNHDTPEFEACAREAVLSLTPEKIADCRRVHEDWWRDFWNESAISIPSEPEIERFWYGSHYIMAACCESGKFPPGLFGNWITTNNPAWAGDYHLNYNYQAPWWGVFSSNHISLADPYDQPLLDYIPVARKNANDLLGCRGLYSRVGIGPLGYETSRMFRKDGREDFSAPFWGQKSNASYAAVNMLMRFYSTWDEQYARSCLLPYLQEAADFWEDYLKFEDGRYVIYNDCIHENGYLARDVFSWAGGTDYSDDFNPIVSLGLVRMVFRGMLDVSNYLGIHEERREKWTHILDHISDYPTQEREGKTVFRYTERGMDWCDGNSLGIQHIYPAGQIGLGSDEALLKIALDTVAIMGRWSDHNAFPTFFTAAVRLGYDPDTILANLKAQFLNHSFPNLFIFFGGGGIECCSAVPGCVNEMLFQSHESVLRFFPVWDKIKDAAFESLRGYGAFIVSAELKNGEIGEITLMSEQGRPCAVLCPWGNGMTVTENGAPVEFSTVNTKDGVVYHFNTAPGAQYVLHR